MRRRALGVLFLAVMLAGCGEPATPVSPTPPPQAQTGSASTSDRFASTLLAAPTLLNYNGQVIVTGAILEDTVPFGSPSPVEGSTPVTGTIVVWSMSHLTAQAPSVALHVTRAWLVRKASAPTVYQLGYSERDDSAADSLDFSQGPAIGPAAVVDSVVELTDGASVFLLRAADQPISVTYAGADLLTTAPLVASLAGQSVSLSGGGIFN